MVVNSRTSPQTLLIIPIYKENKVITLWLKGSHNFRDKILKLWEVIVSGQTRVNKYLIFYEIVHPRKNSTPSPTRIELKIFPSVKNRCRRSTVVGHLERRHLGRYGNVDTGVHNCKITEDFWTLNDIRPARGIIIYKLAAVVDQRWSES